MMGDIEQEHKFPSEIGRAATTFRRMMSRALWTALLTLIAWIPFGHAESRALRSDRSLYALSALDVASDSPARIGQRSDLLRNVIRDRAPTPPRVLPTHDSGADVPAPS